MCDERRELSSRTAVEVLEVSMRAVLLAVMLLLPSIALAQDPAPATHVLPPIHIYPRGPHVTVMLPRRAPRFERTEFEQHSVDRIVDSVRHAPF
jgi:hypothetical protein